MSGEQMAVDMAARATFSATQNAITMMVIHMRKDHGYGIRKIGRRLKLTDNQVKKIVGER